MLNKIKNDILQYGNRPLKIKINNVRNKTEYISGVVCEVYDRIFVVNCSDGLKRSFNYSDILICNIEIDDKTY